MSTMTGIPQAMRELNQWMIAGPDKNPLAISPDGFTTYRGSKSNPDQRMAYSDAMYFADELGLEVGFVTLPDDPFTIIDLDHKPDRVYDADSEAFKTSMYQNAVESTYVELSRSGLGVHIVVIGSIAHDFNAQSAGVECYCNKGFVVMTGRQVSASNEITEQQPLVEFLSEKYKGAVEASQFENIGLDKNQVNNPSQDEVDLDRLFAESMDKWANTATIEKWMADNPGDDRSAVDMKVMQLFVKFSKGRKFPDETAIRMFMRCPRGRLLGRKQDVDQYLKRTLVGAKARVALDEKRAKDFDFAEGSRAMLQGFLDGMQPKAAEQAPSSESPAPMHMGSMGQRAPIEAPAPFTGFSWLTGDELEQQPDIDWVVRGIFPTKGVGAIYGESGAGKSLVGMDMIAAIADGRKWFGLRTKALPVSIFALEGEGGLKGRKRAWETQNNRKFPNNIYFWDSARNGSFALRDSAGYDPTQKDYNKERLVKLCADLIASGRRGGVVVIDTLNQASDGADENSSRDMGELLRAMKFIQRETDSLVLIVHHSTKSKENQSMRGHSSLYGAMDGIIEVVREVYNDDDSLMDNRRAWVVKKSKDGKDGGKHFFNLVEHSVGMTQLDGPITGATIEEVISAQIDQATGELVDIFVGKLSKSTGAGSRGGNGGGSANGNGGRKSREPSHNVGDKHPPPVTNPRSGPTYDYSNTAANDPTPARSSKQASEQRAKRYDIAAILDQALAIGADRVKNSNKGKWGAPADKHPTPRDELITIITDIINPDEIDPAFKTSVKNALGYAVSSGKLGRSTSEGKQYLWVA